MYDQGLCGAHWAPILLLLKEEKRNDSREGISWLRDVSPESLGREGNALSGTANRWPLLLPLCNLSVYIKRPLLGYFWLNCSSDLGTGANSPSSVLQTCSQPFTSGLCSIFYPPACTDSRGCFDPGASPCTWRCWTPWGSSEPISVNTLIYMISSQSCSKYNSVGLRSWVSSWLRQLSSIMSWWHFSWQTKVLFYLLCFLNCTSTYRSVDDFCYVTAHSEAEGTPQEPFHTVFKFTKKNPWPNLVYPTLSYLNIHWNIYLCIHFIYIYIYSLSKCRYVCL